MTRLQLAALRLSIVLLTVMGGLVGLIWLRAAPHVEAGAGTFYGTDTTMTINAMRNTWPQGNGAYCGIATAEAAVNYDDEVHSVPMPFIKIHSPAMRFTSTADQVTVAKANQTSGKSQWGNATPINPYAGITNIAPDFGTDPRSIAYMTRNYAPPNTFFHNYIYRWQFVNSSQPTFSTQVQQATTNIGRALKDWHEPVNVTINGGLHSVLVTGIYSLSDPATTYPAQISSVVYHDPEASPSVGRFEVDFATWSGGHYATPFGTYSLWSLYYGDKYTVGDRQNTSDPEPTVGPYKPTTTNPRHWFGGFTWIQRDNNYANGADSPDWAYTSTGSKMTTP